MELVTAKRAAELSGIPYETLLRDIRCGNFSSTRDHKGHHQINMAELNKFYAAKNSSKSKALQSNDSVLIERPMKNAFFPEWPGESVRIFNSGKSTNGNLRRMFYTHGPFVIGDYRLDRLLSAEIVRDASTITTHTESIGKTSADTNNLTSRALVGGLIAGSAGAIIGGVTAKTNTTTYTKATESVDTVIYMSLKFRDHLEPISIQIFSEKALQKILSCAGQKEWSQTEIEQASKDEKLWTQEKQLRVVEQKAADAMQRTGTFFDGVFAITIYVAIFFLLLWIFFKQTDGFWLGMVKVIVALVLSLLLLILAGKPFFKCRPFSKRRKKSGS